MPGDVNTEIRNGLKWLRAQGDAHTGPHLGRAIAYLEPDNHSQLAVTTIEDIARFAQDSISEDGADWHRREFWLQPGGLLMQPPGHMPGTHIPGTLVPIGAAVRAPEQAAAAPESRVSVGVAFCQ